MILTAPRFGLIINCKELKTRDVPVTVTAGQLEARVLGLVDTVLSGGRVEDDFVESKSNWPALSKARQLAASANSARGDPVLWIIGLDEDAHQLIPLDSTDPSQWWSQISARFDQDVAPT